MSSVERSDRRHARHLCREAGRGKIDFLEKIVLVFIDKLILAFPLEVREVLRDNGDE